MENVNEFPDLPLCNDCDVHAKRSIEWVKSKCGCRTLRSLRLAIAVAELKTSSQA